MIVVSEEQDEEAAEWEYEQLRRGGLRTPEPEAKVKLVYKPTPSTLLMHYKVIYIVLTHSVSSAYHTSPITRTCNFSIVREVNFTNVIACTKFRYT